MARDAPKSAIPAMCAHVAFGVCYFLTAQRVLDIVIVTDAVDFHEAFSRGLRSIKQCGDRSARRKSVYNRRKSVHTLPSC